MDDEAYRRRILTQLNRGEARHGLSRAVFYGRCGEVRQRYREGQEEQLGALGLVVNAIILWNTYYIDAAVERLRLSQMAIDPKDLARLSPLGRSHLNILGRCLIYLNRSRMAQCVPCVTRMNLKSWNTSCISNYVLRKTRLLKIVSYVLQALWA